MLNELSFSSQVGTQVKDKRNKRVGTQGQRQTDKEMRDMDKWIEKYLQVGAKRERDSMTCRGRVVRKQRRLVKDL